MTEIRIGAGVPGPALPPPAPQRKRRTDWIVGAAVVLLLASATAAVYQFGFRDTASPAVLPSTAASPSGPTQLTADEACQLFFPAMKNGTDQVLAITREPHGTTVDWRLLDSSILMLESIQPGAPANLRPDIGSQLATLKELKAIHEGAPNKVMDYREFRASGLRLTAACAPYARG